MVRLAFPPEVSLELTYLCNARCIHCSLECPRTFPSELEFSEWDKLLQEMYQMGTMVVTFTGGEPLLSPDLFPLMKNAHGLDLKMNLCTNGLLLEKKVIETLESCGLNSMTVSLEGPNASIHDYIVQVDGAFEHTMEIIPLLLDSHINLRIDYTVTAINSRVVVDTIELLHSMGVKRIGFQKLTMKGRAFSEIEPTPETYVRVVLDILNTYEHFKGTAIELPILPTSYYREHFKEEIPDKINKRSLVPFSRLLARCTVNPAGDVRPCYLGSENVGNIREKDFSTIWRESTKDFRACRGCALDPFCESMIIVR